MKLLVDAGNTRVKLSWIASADAERVEDVAAFGYDDLASLASWVAALPQQTAPAMGVSVVSDDAMARVEAVLAERSSPSSGQVRVQWQQSQPLAAGVRNDYQPAHQLGADRWAALLGVAAHERRRIALGDARTPVLLVSFGTATTVDALLPQGSGDAACDYAFPGGLILPGLGLMARSLAQGTARLPAVPGKLAPFPVQTRDAIATGIMAAQVGAVWRQWRQLAGPDGEAPAPRLYVSGGAWEQVATELRQWFGATDIVHVPAPVLDGLAALSRG